MPINIKSDSDVTPGTYFFDVAVESVDENLVAHWKFDEIFGDTMFDSSGNGNDGVFNGESFNDGAINGAQRVTGRYLEGLQFDGVDDYVNFGDINVLDTPGYFTVLLWFKRNTDRNDATNHGTDNVLIAQSSDGSNDNFEIGTDGSNIEIYIDSSGFDGSRSYNAGILNSVWYHLALTYDKDNSNEAKLYLNGNLITQWSDWGGNLDSSGSSPLTAGIARPDKSNPWGDFDGIIDETRIYNRALDQTEIQESMNSNYPVTGNGLVAAYGFNEGSGTTAYDTHNRVQGQSNGAIWFDGVDDFIDAGLGDSLKISGALTMDFWMYGAGSSGDSGLVGTGISNYQCTYNTGTTVWCYIQDGGNHVEAVVDRNGWRNIKFVWDGTTNTNGMKLYVDGVLKEENTSTFSPISGWGNLLIGSATSYFNGIIDEVQIWNATSQTQTTTALNEKIELIVDVTN